MFWKWKSIKVKCFGVSAPPIITVMVNISTLADLQSCHYGRCVSAGITHYWNRVPFFRLNNIIWNAKSHTAQTYHPIIHFFSEKNSLFHLKEVNIFLREAILRKNKDFLWNHFIKWRPPRPPLMMSLFIFFNHSFNSEKKRWFWRVFEGCWRVF